MIFPARPFNAGTTSQSFQIGKGGPTIYQGTTAPTTGSFKLGDLYLQTGTSAGVYQQAAAGWTLLGTSTTAAALTTARTIQLAGDVAGAVLFDGSSNVTLTATLAATGIAAGTYTSLVVNAKGLITNASNPVVDAATAVKLATGRAINLIGDATGSVSFDGTSDVTLTATLAASGVVAGNYSAVAVNAKGQIISGLALSALGDATGTASGTTIGLTLAASGVTPGTFGTTTVVPVLAIDAKGRVTSASAASIAFPVTSVNGSLGAVTISSVNGNAATATALATPRTIQLAGDSTGSATFDGSANATITATLAATGVSAGTYAGLVVDAKGRVLATTVGATFQIVSVISALYAPTFTATSTKALGTTYGGSSLYMDANNVAIRMPPGGAFYVQDLSGGTYYPIACGTATLGQSPGLGNSVVVAGASAGSSPSITAQGSDSSVDLNISPKGSGKVVLNGTLSLPLLGSSDPGVVNAVWSKNGVLVLSGAPSALTPGTYTAIAIDQRGLVTSGSNPVVSYATQAGTLANLISATAPTSPVNSQLWWSSTDGKLYIYYGNAFTEATTHDVPTATTSMAGAVKVGAGLTVDQDGTLATLGGDIGRNRLHNGLFRIFQRGSNAIVSTAGYPADRWVHFDNGNGSRTVQVVALTDTDRSAIGDEIAQYTARIQTTGSSGAGDYEQFLQRLEDVRLFAGKTITLSFWAKAAVTGQPIAPEFEQFFGSGGSPSAAVFVPLGVINLATSWTRYVITFSAPSSAGKTFGGNGTDYSVISFWTSSGTTYASRASNIGAQTSDIQLWGAQLEIGSAATPIERPSITTEVATCQRFYYQGQFNIAGYNTVNANVGGALGLPVIMRAQPTVGIMNNYCSNVSNLVVNTNGGSATLFLFGIATATGSYILNVVYTASADL